MIVFNKNCDKIKALRQMREYECFKIVNRGKVWYDRLTSEQLIELKNWYEEWLNVTETLEIPIRPKFLDDKLIKEEIKL